MREYRSWHLRVPTLHLYGREDPLTPVVPESYRRYTDDMTVEILPECGHFIPEEAPDRLLERLEAFL